MPQVRDNPATIAPDDTAGEIGLDTPFSGGVAYGYEGTRGESLNQALQEGIQSGRW